MDIKRSRISSGILAILAASVISCGTVQGASGKAGSSSGGGDVYITSDEQGNGVQITETSGGPAIVPASDGFGRSLQP